VVSGASTFSQAASSPGRISRYCPPDHTHLGQLLTHCAGVGADVVIWIARSITDEHAAALEWLNDNTVAGVGFFGIEVEPLRIGDSLPAPNFKTAYSHHQCNRRTGSAVAARHE
jgi:hypothetical protein